MPPTHPSQADVAAAYRTLIAHETEPKEQDFYRTRLQRVEQAAEPVCEFDCRSRVAAAGVGIYCPQCSAKSADTDLTTQLAIQQIEGEAAWWRSIDFDRNASRTFESMTGDSQQAVRTGVERVLAHLTAAGRLRALFPATDLAEDGWGDVNPNDPQGRTYRETAEEYYSEPTEPDDESAVRGPQKLIVRPADAEFIAHARTALPALVAAVERVQALHTKSNQGYGEDDYCDCCGTNWPCPTIEALETP